MNGTLWQRLSEIDQSCNERLAVIIPATAKREGMTEALKVADQMEWAQIDERLQGAGGRDREV